MYSLNHLFWTTCDRDFITAKNGVDYKFLRKENTLYIVFAPSKGFIDWKHNFMFRKKPYKDMKIPYRVHRGFLKCWKEIEDIIIETILDPTVKEIVIVGYSHGGALSMLCHECCWFHREDIRDNIWGIGFDSPRVFGARKIKPELQERWSQYIVIKNYNDLVTRLPPVLFGYCHVGHLIHIGVNERVNCIKAHDAEEISNSLRAFKNNHNWKELCK